MARWRSRGPTRDGYWRMEKESSGQKSVEANSTGGQGSRRAVAPRDDDKDECCNVRVTYYWDAFAKPLLLWKSNNYYTFLCVWSRVSACVGVCVCVRACACVRARLDFYVWCPAAWACVCACTRIASLVQHATSMRHTLSLFVACLATPGFSTISRKRHDFRKNVAEHNTSMCVLSFSTSFI
jgi:hypothetical protein